MKKLIIGITATLAVLVAGFAVAQVNPLTLGDVFGWRPVVITRTTGNSNPRAGALHIGRVGTNVEFPSTTHRITRLLYFANTVDIGSISAVTCLDTTTTTAGARVGDVCMGGTPSAGGAANIAITCRVSATDTVTLRACNPTAGAIDPASTTFPLYILSNQ